MWISNTEREYFVTVARPTEDSELWMVFDGRIEREVTTDWITSGFMLDSPWSRRLSGGGELPIRPS